MKQKKGSKISPLSYRCAVSESNQILEAYETSPDTNLATRNIYKKNLRLQFLLRTFRVIIASTLIHFLLESISQ